MKNNRIKPKARKFLQEKPPVKISLKNKSFPKKNSSSKLQMESLKKKSSCTKNYPNSLDKFLESNQVLIYGKHPVFAALINKKRKIYQILTTKNIEADLKQFIALNKIIYDQNLLKIVDSDHIRSLLPDGCTHQGLLLKTCPITTISHHHFLEKISRELSKKDFPKILVLDNLTDPHNIGAIIRSAAAFNFSNIVFTERNFPLNSPVIAKNACGMLEKVQLISTQNLNNFILDFKKIGYWLAGLDGQANFTLKEAKNYQPLALILGSEGEGIRRLVKQHCDLLIKIDINSEVESINASNAAAIAMYELCQI